jgi:hypothetical protein
MTIFVTITLCVLLLGLGLFQVVLASGAPLGQFAWGGQNRVLPARLRAGSIASAALYAAFIVLVLDRAGVVTVLPNQVAETAMWALSGLLALGAVPNLMSSSKHERYLMAPLALVMSLLSLIVALSPDLLRTIVIVAVHTPIWVWPLYCLLLFLGLQRTRDSSVTVLRVLSLPLVVAGLAIWSFIGAGMTGLPVMLLGLALGSAVGWQFERDGATRRLADGKIFLRGEWLSFVQIVVVLVFRYAINVVPFAAPTLNANPIWHMSSLFVSAALSALFLGRTAAKLRVYFARTTVSA